MYVDNTSAAVQSANDRSFNELNETQKETEKLMTRLQRFSMQQELARIQHDLAMKASEGIEKIRA